MTEEQRYAKLPEGVSPPTNQANQEPPKGLRVKDFEIDPGLPIIQYPHYIDNKKSKLSCILLRPDGMATVESEIPADTNHPLYRDIVNQFTEEELVTNTNREVQIQKARNYAMEEAKSTADREEIRAKLWEVKSQFMDMPVVKNSENKLLKRNLRKSTTYFEALAYGCAILIEDSNKSE
jgi:hypothetical protein